MEEHVRQSIGQTFDYRCDRAGRCRSRGSPVGRYSVVGLFGQGKWTRDDEEEQNNF